MTMDENCKGCIYVREGYKTYCATFEPEFQPNCPCKLCILKANCSQSCPEFLELEEKDLQFCMEIRHYDER